MNTRVITYLFLIFFIFCGCRATKQHARQSNLQSGVERLERVLDSLRVETALIKDVDVSKIDLNNLYRKTTRFADNGNVASITEEWQNSDTKTELKEKSEERKIQTEKRDKAIVARDTISLIHSENSTTKTDSRPVQGAEWFWLVLGIIAAIGITIYIYIKR